MSGQRARVAAAVLAGAALMLAACTGVPTSSTPQTVEPLHLAGGAASVSYSPRLGEQPYDIVNDFLRASADPAGSASARSFLTGAARSQWSDATATVVDQTQVNSYDSKTHSVTVVGRLEGTIDAHGIYTSTSTSTPTQQKAQYKFVKVGGEYRISALPQGGVLLSDQTFRSTYRQYSLYFYDLSDQYLVPDPRWTAVFQEPAGAAQWLVTQLVEGPRSLLNNAVSTDTMPAQIDTHRISVSGTSPMQIELPGSSQLPDSVRDRLAAQIAATVDQVQPGLTMELTDDKQPVEIKAAHGTDFSLSSLSATTAPTAPEPDVYYLLDGHLYAADGDKVAGPLNAGNYYLDSIALGRPAPGSPLFAAAVVPGRTESSSTLVVGTQSLGFKATKIHGLLSRPAFAPGRNEVWIGAGSQLLCGTVNPQTGSLAATPVPLPSGGGRIVSVRLSPEGTRIALVILAADGTPQLWVGAISRQNGQIRIESSANMALLSQPGAVISDVAWLDPLRLVAIGYTGSADEQRLFEFGVDGSEWTSLTVTLVNHPDSVTVTPNRSVWVSAGGDVWIQNGSSWQAPVKSQTPGTNPVYVE